MPMAFARRAIFYAAAVVTTAVYPAYCRATAPLLAETSIPLLDNPVNSISELHPVDVDGDGQLDLAFTYFDGSTGHRLAIRRATSAAAVDVVRVGYRRKVEFGDLDRDGILDLVVSANDAEHVTVLRGLGRGEFGSATEYGEGGYALAVLDFNGDSLLDVVVARRRELVVLEGLGDGTLGMAHTIAQGEASNVLAADVDEDGYPDVVFTTHLTAMVHGGRGWLSELVLIDPVTAPAGATRTLFAGDFDGDSHLDLAVGDYTLLYGNGRRVFSVAQSPGRVSAAGDLNGDGRTDLVVGSEIALGNANRTFTTTDEHLPWRAQTICDWNHDGIPDIVAAAGVTRDTRPNLLENLFVVLGHGDGHVSDSADFGWEGVVADFNADGRADFVDEYQGVFRASLSTGGSRRLTKSWYTGAGVMSALVPADLEGDGALDLLMSVSDGTVLELRNDGRGNFTPGFTFAGLGGTPLAKDLDGDGQVEVVGAGGVYARDTGGGFRRVCTLPAGVCAAGDFDGDSQTDLAVAAGSTLTIYYATGHFVYEARGLPLWIPAVQELRAADLDGDGRLDLIASGNTETFVLFAEHGSPFWDIRTVLRAGKRIAATDFDLDGRPELIVDAFEAVTIFQVTAARAFHVAQQFATGPQTFPPTPRRNVFHAGDVTDDGLPDLVVAGRIFRHNGFPFVRDLRVASNGREATIHFTLTTDAMASLEAIAVERSNTPDGVFVTAVDGVSVAPDVVVTVPQPESAAWYRLRMRTHDGAQWSTAPLPARQILPTLLLGAHVEGPDGAVQMRIETGASSSSVVAQVFDVRGRRLWSARLQDVPVGFRELTWDRRDAAGGRAANGMYFVHVSTAAGNSATQKIVLVN